MRGTLSGDRLAYRRAVPTYPGSDGAELSYDDPRSSDGADPPLIALAGGAARHPDYLGDLAGLGTRQRLIIPHLRGVGRSPMPDDVQLASFWRQADDLERLREHLGLEQLRLIGHSAGTRLAIAYAAQFPERVATMVLVTPPPAYPPPAGSLVDVPSDAGALMYTRRGEPAFDAALAAWDTGPDAETDEAFNAWQQQVAPLGYAAWGPAEQAHAAGPAYTYAANRAYFSVDPPADLAARLGAVTAPVLVIAGSEDYGIGVAPVVALAKLFPAGSAVVIEGAAHHPWVEQPAAFRRETDRFLP
jgi:pimeloyl-ACP methyl ester carboxylesterase